ncbi:MAG TPA: hypothetical protein VHU91_03330 [Mycobacteriales bacterium]|nr:hypothetical protein [Mycobacteriales bacterium]
MTTPAGDNAPQEPTDELPPVPPETGMPSNSTVPPDSPTDNVAPTVIADRAPGEPEPADAERKRRMKWLIAAGVAVVLIGTAIGVSIWYFTSPTSADSPSEAVKLYMKSIKEHDADQAGEVLCKKITKGKKLKVSDYSFDKFNYDVREPQRVSAHEYYVGVDVDAVFNSDGKKTTQKSTQVYRVIKEDGSWRTCGVLGQSAPPGSAATASGSR